MFIDTHAHLNFKTYKSDYKKIIAHSIEAGVNKIVCPSSNLETSKKAVKIAKNFDNVFAAVGLHPIHVNDEKFGEEFAKLAAEKMVVAIGETGLDYYYDKSTASVQRELLEKHIKLANLVRKPIILHCRDAYHELISILMAQNQIPEGVIHCYLGNWEYAKVFLDMGFYLSFTGIITFTKNEDILEVVKNAPLDKIMIETDSPYLAPEPHRGKQNEPAFVIEVAKKIAEIKKISLKEVEEQTTKNAEKLFKLQ